MSRFQGKKNKKKAKVLVKDAKSLSTSERKEPEEGNDVLQGSTSSPHVCLTAGSCSLWSSEMNLVKSEPASSS